MNELECISTRMKSQVLTFVFILNFIAVSVVGRRDDGVCMIFSRSDLKFLQNGQKCVHSDIPLIFKLIVGT